MAIRLYLLLGAALSAVAAACGARPAPQDPVDLPPPDDRISLVTSFVVVEACPGAKLLNTRQASKEIEEMLAPCTRVPAGSAHFSATLLPDGHVELGSPSKNPAEGNVPTCILQNKAQLRHKLKLAKPCRFDVKLEERKGEP